ncbi:MAG: phosphodiester glycosidase family protein [Deltaproteobacteria bacterium]|nr:phosphodiester glycosidase family protein [Deltaproteobacteria bacterium]
MAGVAALVIVGSLLALRAGVQHTSWLGPWLADVGRSVVGAPAVGKVEDAVYGVEEQWNRWRHASDPPQPMWRPAPSVPSAAGPQPAPKTADNDVAFKPAPVGPMHERYTSTGDGLWTPLADARQSGEPARMYKTFLHPDDARAWAAVAVVAVDLSSVELHLEPGLYVPEATEPEARTMSRPGLIPKEHQSTVLAAFNGGFKAVHGNLGMHVHGITLLRAQPWGCTIVKTSDGRIAIDTWSELEGEPASRVWWRQTPQCLVRKGRFGDGVLVDGNTNWGASVSGSTYIRRSAVGIDATGRVLFVGIGEAVTASGMARAMAHAGADTVGQLDVNGSLPKFLLFEPQTLTARPLYPGLIHSRGEYVRDASSRDFFYITRKAVGEGAKAR